VLVLAFVDGAVFVRGLAFEPLAVLEAALKEMPSLLEMPPAMILATDDLAQIHTPILKILKPAVSIRHPIAKKPSIPPLPRPDHGPHPPRLAVLPLPLVADASFQDPLGHVGPCFVVFVAHWEVEILLGLGLGLWGAGEGSGTGWRAFEAEMGWGVVGGVLAVIFAAILLIIADLLFAVAHKPQISKMLKLIIHKDTPSHLLKSLPQPFTAYQTPH
jgi:hypothetical protein